MFVQHLSALQFLDLEKKEVRFSNIYVCPICLQTFKVDISSGIIPDELTVEDAPPKSLGGKPTAITCSSCNNGCGHKIDVYLNNEMEYRDNKKLSSLQSLRGAVSLKEIKVNAGISIDNDARINLDIDRRRNNPVSCDALDEVFRKSWDGLHFDVSFSLSGKRDLEKAKLALLKSAYIIAFRRMGYVYIFQPQMQLIRDLIMDSLPNPEYPHFVFNPGEDVADGLYLATVDDTKCILVVMSLSRISGSEHRYAVALPHPDDRENSLYCQILSSKLSSGNRLVAKNPIPFTYHLEGI